MSAKYDNWLPKLFIRFNGAKTWAVTIGQTARYSVPESQVSPAWHRHEDTHKAQFAKHGVVGFFWLYFTAMLKNKANGMTWDEAYLAIPFEVEARAAADRVE